MNLQLLGKAANGDYVEVTLAPMFVARGAVLSGNGVEKKICKCRCDHAWWLSEFKCQYLRQPKVSVCVHMWFECQIASCFPPAQSTPTPSFVHILTPSAYLVVSGPTSTSLTLGARGPGTSDYMLRTLRTPVKFTWLLISNNISGTFQM